MQNNIITKESINKKTKKDVIIDQYTQEIIELINNPEFFEFAETLNEFIEDGLTFNEILSSQLVLKKALAIIRQSKNESKKLPK